MRQLCLLPLILACGLNAFGQCVLDPIRVGRVEGYVVFGFQENYRILDKGEVRLLSASSPEKTIASTATDKDGHFELTDVAPGKYVLSVRSEALIPASVDLEVTKSKDSKRLIFVVLGADATKECGGASIKVQSKLQADRILGSAQRPSR